MFFIPPSPAGEGVLLNSRVGPKWLKSENVLNLRNFSSLLLQILKIQWMHGQEEQEALYQTYFFDDPQGRGSTSRVGQNRHKVKHDL